MEPTFNNLLTLFGSGKIGKEISYIQTLITSTLNVVQSNLKNKDGDAVLNIVVRAFTK